MITIVASNSGSGSKPRTDPYYDVDPEDLEKVHKDAETVNQDSE